MLLKKIFILLPDGVGLRNFAFTSFVEIGEKHGWEVIFWNQTLFDLTELGYREIKLSGKPRAFTDLLKRAKIDIELDYFEERFEDPIYQSYKFPSSTGGIKSRIKNIILTQLVNSHKGGKGLQKLRKKLKASERKSLFYKECTAVLKREKPDFIFCTNQRPVTAIAPLTAAQDLGIPTGSFIFSWDNLPKATLIIEPDFYFVWSKYMKKELLGYYPHIKKSNIYVTGTPQFETHGNDDLVVSREDFFSEYNLDPDKEYICFSGDDETTSPDDSKYLNDVAEAISNLNRKENYRLGIIFRRCPVDFSKRYDKVIEKYKELIVPISPAWEQVGENWNTVLPTIKDSKLLVNTIAYSRAIVNLGSSMVFDSALLNKPCMFLRYDVENKNNKNWSVAKIYDFVHFRSMPTGKEVIWIDSKKEIGNKIKQALDNSDEELENAKKWLAKINFSPVEKASENIWNSIKEIKVHEADKN